MSGKWTGGRGVARCQAWLLRPVIYNVVSLGPGVGSTRVVPFQHVPPLLVRFRHARPRSRSRGVRLSVGSFRVDVSSSSS
jgi:hypothetical protein